MIYALDLFSGIGGLTEALSPWVRPLLYCEIDRYAQGVLLSRMQDGRLPIASIWDDVRSMSYRNIPQPIDIIYGGFPCQDLSVAGTGAGLEGKRSGLFFEIMRLAKEIKPTFLFLENVPAIRTRGAKRVATELARLRYDCRWGVISAFDVGAPHKRGRWFLLAHGHRHRLEVVSQSDGQRSLERRPRRHDTHRLCDTLPHTDGNPLWHEQQRVSWRRSQEVPHQAETQSPHNGCEKSLANLCQLRSWPGGKGTKIWQRERNTFRRGWWATEPNVGRVANGVLARVDRVRCLGNAVVPFQAREAFRRLLGLKETV